MIRTLEHVYAFGVDSEDKTNGSSMLRALISDSGILNSASVIGGGLLNSSSISAFEAGNTAMEALYESLFWGEDA